MNKSEAFPSKYLKATELDGEDITATINSVEWEQIGQDKTEKPVLYFRGKTKPMILNATNWDLIVKATGESDSDEWEGKKITLYRTEVPFKKEMVDAIRVRAESKSKRPEKPKVEQPPADDDMPF